MRSIRRIAPRHRLRGRYGVFMATARAPMQSGRLSQRDSVRSFWSSSSLVRQLPPALSRSIVGAPYGSLAVPLAGGLALASLVASLGRISGGHLNPAVTLGLAVHRRFKWAYVPSYLAAQLVGATVAAAVAWSLYGGRARTTAHLGATYPSTGTGLGRAFLAETVVTFILVWVVVSVGSNPKASPAISAVAIGFALAAAIFIAGPVSGGAVNPARALGPMLVSGKFTDWWIYLVGPVLGAVAAVGLYRGLGDERA